MLSKPSGGPNVPLMLSADLLSHRVSKLFRLVLMVAVITVAAGWLSASARADVSTLSPHWQVQSSANTSQYAGNAISLPGFGTSGWMPETADDAGGGLTEIGALGQNGLQAPGQPNPLCSFAPETPGD